MINFIPSWLVIGFITFFLAFLFNRLSLEDRRWFNRLRRPAWLTFEVAIPFIWIFIFTCGAASANHVWQVAPNSKYTWFLMACYLLWEISILAYTPVMCKFRSLMVGTIIGAVGFLIGLFLMLLVLPVSFKASMLILPHILWSPIGTYVTWKMISLNPGNA